MSFSPQQTTVQQSAIANITTALSPQHWVKTSDLNHSLPSGAINTSLRIDPDSVMLGDQTLGEVLRSIREQIALLVPDIELHREYSELRALHDQYQKKLAEIKEKRRMWESLKK